MKAKCLQGRAALQQLLRQSGKVVRVQAQCLQPCEARCGLWHGLHRKVSAPQLAGRPSERLQAGTLCLRLCRCKSSLRLPVALSAAANSQLSQRQSTPGHAVRAGLTGG